MKLHTSLTDSVREHFDRTARRRACGRLGVAAWGNFLNGLPRTSISRRHRNRRGSTLLVVMALLGMLTLLGLLFFTFASQENANAINFMEAAKRIDDPGDDIDAILDETIRQLIQGARPDQKQSIQWGGRHSLVTNLYGNDLHPHSGVGVNLRAAAVGAGFYVFVDQDRDGTADPLVDANYNLLQPNDSPAARSDLFERDVKLMPTPDVGYTYPDLNFMALGYKSYVLDANGAKIEILKPSFHRPELFHDSATGLPLADWYNKTGYGGRTFRPHPEHNFVPKQNQNIAPGDPDRFRFLDPARPADVALIASLPTGCTTGFLFGTEPAVGANGTLGEQGVWSLTGKPATAADVPRYEYDMDNDEGGSGTREGIWVDMDHNVLIRPSDNATYIPLISISMYEMDGRINVNTAGNLSGDSRSVSPTFGYGGDISRSSQGLSTSEINPGWVLDTHPTEAASLSDHTLYFGTAPVGQQDLANTEIWWLKKGRIEYSTPRQLHAGVYGETNRLWDVLSAAAAGPGGVIGVHRSGTPGTANKFPFPGIFDSDDNLDSNEGGLLPNGAAGQSLPFMHPLALSGRGRYWGSSQYSEDLNGNLRLDPGEDTNMNGFLDFDTRSLSLAKPTATNPITWIHYDGVGLGYDDTGTISVGWNQGPYASQLMTNYWVGANFSDGPGFYFDDADEVIHDSRYSQRPYDETIETKEILLPNMTPTDRSNLGMTSRILDLMPANLTPNGTQQYQLEVGKRLTTDSWDLQNFALPRNPERNWEFNVDADQDSYYEFPPQFTGAAAFAANDPFRPQLRRLLNVEEGNLSTTPVQRRLNINQFLDVEHVQGSVPPKPGDATYEEYYRNRPMVYRPLTPHAVSDTLTTLPSGAPALPAYPPANDGDQEFWARRDRQQMARDIYVMLYTFCGGNNSTDMSSTAGDTAYPPASDPTKFYDQRRFMAQFAVNVVDALDRDDVITQFEYDTDLSNGWDLDDNPSTADPTDRDFVYGVEAQQLTFSEVAWFKQNRDNSTNHPLTPFDEQAGDHHFIHMELQSVSSNDVPLTKPVSTTRNTAIWRIHRDDNNDGVINGMGMGMGASTENAVYFLNGTGGGGAPTMTVAAGGLYTIASADSSTVGSSSLYVDHSGTGTTFELVSPNKVGAPAYSVGTGIPNPVADLDLLHTNHNGYSILESGAAGDFLNRNNAPGAGMGMGMGMGPKKKSKKETHLRLDRRLNTNLPALLLADNPWVTVDRFEGVDRIPLGIDSSVMTQVAAAAMLSDPELSSQERRQPFEGEINVTSGGVAPSVNKNTLTQTNQKSPGQFNLFQAHFDRDFASVVELLNIPLSGPQDFTQIVVSSRIPATTQTTTNKYAPFTFGRAMLLCTEDRNDNGTLNGSEDVNGNGNLDSNHFNRFLSLVEIPTRSHRQLGDTLAVSRVPGKVDLNGISSPQVLAAVIDDRDVIIRPERDINNDGSLNNEDLDHDFILDVGEDTNGNGVLDFGDDLNNDGEWSHGLPDNTGELGRDWWKEFLYSRDGKDLISELPLPQSGVSRPFQDVGVTQPSLPSTATSSAIDDTVFRTMRTTMSAAGRPLFDLSSEEEYSLSEDKNANGVFDRSEDLNANDVLDPGEDLNGNDVLDHNDDLNRNGVFDDLNGNLRFDPSRDALARQRILSKVVNNTTTRGNVFIVYVTVGMFGCVERPNGAVRIGGQMDVDGDGQPDTHRAVFIIDRSEAEAAYDKGTGTFDWKKLIKARQRIN